MDLIKNNRVIFTEEPHKYTLINEDFSTRELSGITAIIKKCICPNLYSDVDEETLRKAAEHGTLCHKLCEAFDNAQLDPMDDNQGFTWREDGTCVADGLEELRAYISLIAENDIMVHSSEYLVSDNENFASCIDKVAIAPDGKMADIIDLKFTYAYHEEPVTWQTSFYADIFEFQNPHIKVNKLYCIHIHKYKNGEVKAALHELKRIPTEHLEEAKRCFLSGEEFVNPYARIEKELEIEEELEQQYADILKRSAELEKEKKTVTDALKKLITTSPSLAKLKGRYITVSQSVASHSTVLDEAKLKEEMPEIYKKYCTKVKTVAGRVTITLNKKEK